MRIILYLVLLVFPALSRIDALSSEIYHFNNALREELLAMSDLDQQARHYLLDLRASAGWENITDDHALVQSVYLMDQKHNARLKAILENGWPGTRIIDEDGAQALWLLVQQSRQRSSVSKKVCFLARRSGQKRGGLFTEFSLSD